MYSDDIEYTYLYKTLGEDPTWVKVGHGKGNPFKRVAQQQTGNSRALIIILVIIGDFDGEINVLFAADKFGTGGNEHYKLTPGMAAYFVDKLRFSLGDSIELNHKEFGNGKARLDVVELGSAEPRPLIAVRGQGQIPAYDITDAPTPKSRYARLEKSKQ